jgi:excisionase family DNA binding protein
MQVLLTTQEAAVRAGVGPTAIKRWADLGVLRCVRTAGGHRRFVESELTAFLAAQASPGADGPSEVTAWVDKLLATASAHEVEAQLLVLRGRHGAWYRAAAYLGSALAEIGARWAQGELTIIDEHLVSERLLRAIGRIAESLPVGADAPVVLLTTLEGDEHLLGLSLVELCLRECGLQTRWPGRSTPVDEVVGLLERGGADLVAVSASATSGGPRRLRAWLDRVAPVCELNGVDLILGGEGRWPEPTQFGVRLRSFEELHALLIGRQAKTPTRRTRRTR